MKKILCDFCREEIIDHQQNHDPIIAFDGNEKERLFLCKKLILGESFEDRINGYFQVDCCKKCSSKISEFLFELSEKTEVKTDE